MSGRRQRTVAVVVGIVIYFVVRGGSRSTPRIIWLWPAPIVARVMTGTAVLHASDTPAKLWRRRITKRFS